jgi:hypothetical protein
MQTSSVVRYASGGVAAWDTCGVVACGDAIRATATVVVVVVVRVLVAPRW